MLNLSESSIFRGASTGVCVAAAIIVWLAIVLAVVAVAVAVIFVCSTFAYLALFAIGLGVVAMTQLIAVHLAGYPAWLVLSAQIAAVIGLFFASVALLGVWIEVSNDSDRKRWSRPT